MTQANRRIAATALFIALAAGLAACTSTVVRPSGSTASRSSAPRTSTPQYGVTTQVQRGETLYGIAFRNGIDVRDLAAWNGIGPPYTIYPGQTLRLYPHGGASSGPATAAVRPATTPARPGGTTPANTRPTTAPATAATSASVAKPAERTADPKPPETSVPMVASGIRWQWPVDGQLLNRFVAGEPTRQGLDITGAGGAPVRAAADGVVVYSGSGLVGYGELIIIKHNDAWLSAYGHNRSRMVNEGVIVKAGQQIAVMGRTGAARDMLHFEIRHNGKPVDPLLHLPKR